MFDSYDLLLSGYKNPTLQAWFKQWKEVITSDQTSQAMDSYTCGHYALLFLKAKARNVLKALVEQEWCYWQDNFNEWVTHCLDPAVMWVGYHCHFMQCLAQARRWEDLKQHIDTMGETYLREQMRMLIQSVARVPCKMSLRLFLKLSTRPFGYFMLDLHPASDDRFQIWSHLTKSEGRPLLHMFDEDIKRQSIHASCSSK